MRQHRGFMLQENRCLRQYLNERPKQRRFTSSSGSFQDWKILSVWEWLEGDESASSSYQGKNKIPQTESKDTDQPLAGTAGSYTTSSTYQLNSQQERATILEIDNKTTDGSLPSTVPVFRANSQYVNIDTTVGVGTTTIESSSAWEEQTSVSSSRETIETSTVLKEQTTEALKTTIQDQKRKTSHVHVAVDFVGVKQPIADSNVRPEFKS